MTVAKPIHRPAGVRGARAALAILALVLFGPSAALAGAQMPYGRGLLWQIEGAAEEPSFLFGTMHSADEEVTRLAPPVAEAFARARALALEVIMTTEAQIRMATAMALRDGRTLEQVLGPALFERALAAGRPYGLGPQQLRLFKPWAVMTLLSLPPSEVKRQAAGEAPLDQRLQALAQERGMDLHALEAIEDQIGMLDDMAEDDQIAMLAAVVDQSAEVEALFEKMRGAYLDRRPGRIFELMQAQQTGLDPELLRTFNERLLDRRNARMVAAMEPLLDRGGAFIAVGALHLPGEEGILKHLEERGYRLTRLY